MTAKRVKITLVKSTIGALEKHKQCLIGLGGLRRIRQTSEVIDTPAVRGMINKVRHLIHVEGE
ncbi:MAG: 50S ribosomal protein L30 [Pseudomonadales bacterium]|nr:50S ribosomal protein L30 [Pseudomonadales bacterium]